MSYRLNQYQRRQQKYRINASVIKGTFLTTLLFGAGFLILRSPIVSWMYRVVWDSNGLIAFPDLEAGLMILAIFAFCVVSVLLSIIAWLVAERQYDFEFGDAPQVVVSRERARAIDLYRLSPREFEVYVAKLIAQRGYRTRVVGGGGDQGVDIKVYNQQGQYVGIVQCKRYKPGKALSPTHIRDLSTVRQMQGVPIAYLATTTYYTSRTKRLAERLNVRLIDGHDLRHLTRKIYLPQSELPADLQRHNHSPYDRQQQFRPPTPQPYQHSLNGMWDESLPSNSFPFDVPPPIASEPVESSQPYQLPQRTTPGDPIIRQAPTPIIRHEQNPDARFLPPERRDDRLPPGTYDERLRDLRRR